MKKWGFSFSYLFKEVGKRVSLRKRRDKMMKACEICKVEVAHFLVADVKKGDIVEVCIS